MKMSVVNVCSYVLELFNVILCYVSCFVWTTGRVAAAFATADGDPNKIPNTKERERVLRPRPIDILPL